MKIKNVIFCCLIAGLTSLTINAKDLNTSGNHKDPGVINQERILYWLTKRGTIKATATDAERKKALSDYLKRSKNGAYRLPAMLAKREARLQRTRSEQKANVTLKAVQTKVAVNKTVKILAVLVDFNDLPHDDNRLTSSDTNMYYSNYSKSHYQEMIFSENGYEGPSGQNLDSAYQYYQAESGQTLFLRGQVEGWVRAESDAATYGANDPDNDDDMDVGSLVKEAITKAVALGNINLADFDLEDQYDIDNDGNVNEPDGKIDHVMIYHSSIGEESGGGVLGDNAIWSHRHFVDFGSTYAESGYTIPGTNYKVFGYTIEPLDSAIGVIVHEFGHDLGVADEYNTNDPDSGSPVAYWSLMASGSWTGSPSGTQPSSLSPLASNYFQQKFDGNWSKTTQYSLSGLTASPQTITLNEATDHNAATNLLKVDVPASQINFFPPYTGTYQYYSGDGHLKNNTMSFTLDVPASATDAVLQMKAHWNIELDYDYARVLVNDVAIAGNHTKVNNQFHPEIHNFITDISANIAGAEGPEGWVDLTFNMAAYAGQTVTVTIEYVTDPAVGNYGLAIDDISLEVNSAPTYSDGAEDTPGPVTFNGFMKIESTRPQLTQHYWVQMRSHNGNDAGLASRNYQRGMLVWFEDPIYSDNHVDEHPGHGFIGVIDAGQNNAAGSSTTSLIRDATFSLYDGAMSSVFDDSDDYTTPVQPFSGMVLPRHGLSFSIQSQAADSANASIALEVTEVPWRSAFSYTKQFRTMEFSNDSFGTGNATASWDFGDAEDNLSNEWEPTYVYASSGDFNVTLTITSESDGSTHSTTQTVSIAQPLTTSFTETDNNGVVSFVSSTSGGESNYTYLWDFGDGNSSTFASPSHTYIASGDYSVTLSATSGDNQTATSSQTVTIYILPVATYSVLNTNLTANFTNNSSGGDGNLTYAWDFGDGNSSTEASPSHTYASAGTYTVELTITDGQMNSDTYSSSVMVSEPPSKPKKSGGGGSMGALLLGLLLMFQRLSKIKQSGRS